MARDFMVICNVTCRQKFSKDFELQVFQLSKYRTGEYFRRIDFYVKNSGVDAKLASIYFYVILVFGKTASHS